MARQGAIKATMSRADQEAQYLAHRVRYLPTAIDAARRKVASLEAEARRYGMDDLLESGATFSAAWDREIDLAKAQNVIAGRESTMKD